MVDIVGNSSSKVSVIRVVIERGESGLLLATSPDLRGLLVAERTIDDLEREIPASIGALYRAKGENFVILKAEDLVGDQPVKSWVKISTDTILQNPFTYLDNAL